MTRPTQTALDRYGSFGAPRADTNRKKATGDEVIVMKFGKVFEQETDSRNEVEIRHRHCARQRVNGRDCDLVVGTKNRPQAPPRWRGSVI